MDDGSSQTSGSHRPLSSAERINVHCSTLNLPARSDIIGLMKCFRLGLLCLMCVATTAGCGRGPEAKPRHVQPPAGRESGTPAPAGKPSNVEKRQAGTSDSARPSAEASRTDSQGRQWLGDIPYDVWFDDPLGVVGKGIETPDAGAPAKIDNPSGTETAARGAETNGSVTAGAPSSASGSPAETALESEWKRLLTADVLDAEVKSIRNDLAASLQSIGKYNAKYAEIQMKGATLAAVAEIASEHPDAVRWKTSALYIRDIGAKIAASADKVGGESFQKTKRTFESLTGILDGNTPSGLEEPTTSESLAEFADRGGLMKRMESALEWLKKDIASEQSLKNNAAKVEHEAGLLGALGRVISGKGYPMTDEEEFIRHAKEFIESSAELSRSGTAGEYPAFSNARDRVQKKCDECHQTYRF